MTHHPTRRALLGSALAAPLAKMLAAQSKEALPAGQSAVALVGGEDRRKNVFESLMAVDDQIKPKLSRMKSVVIKPNNVSTNRQLAATHADALRGILDYLERRFKGPVFIAESSAGDTMTGYENFKYTALPGEYKKFPVKLIDLNDEKLYEICPILDGDLHMTPVRLGKRLLDPEAFVINAAMLKTHNTVVATLSIKNMCLGAPLHQAPKETPRWNDKRKYHGGVRQTHIGIMQTAVKLAPSWGVSVIDGYEGMEGNGPGGGTPVASRLAIASTDFVAADRVGVEMMGVNPDYPGYLKFCEMAGLGNYDWQKITIRGEDPAKLKKKYQLHADIEKELEWMGPLKEIPPKLG
jgi:uncharacterized protein (DUF362 family)